jgi:polar amino acid transport system permease protein
VRHWGRWVASAIVLFIVAVIVYSVVNNPRFQWGVVGDFLFDPRIVRGARVTLELTFLAMVIGIVLGVVLAVMRLSPNPLVVALSSFYIWFFRGTPVLVQILFWQFVGALYPKFSIGIPFGGPVFASVGANHLITTFVAGLLGLGLNEGAYMAEIVRAGILSVDEGQTEAAQSLGMRRILTLRRVVLPQAMRVIIPPTGNETISMLKTTSLVSVIGIFELTGSAQSIYLNATFLQIPLLVVASIWYLVMTSILSIGQYFLERRFGRGTTRVTVARPGQRLIARMAQRRDSSSA